MSMNAYYPVTGKKLLSFALAALMIGSLFGGVLWRTGEVYSIKKHAFTRFTSQQELVDFPSIKKRYPSFRHALCYRQPHFSDRVGYSKTPPPHRSIQRRTSK